MKFSTQSIHRYSDRRLLNVVIYKTQYNYPFDYVEACKDELRQRGYSNADILSAVEYATTDNAEAPVRFELKTRLKTRTRLLWWLPGISALLFTLLFSFGETLPAPVRKFVGGLALACFFLFFLVYVNISLLKGQLARLDTADYHNLYTS